MTKKVSKKENKEMPSKYLIKCIKEAREDIKNGDYYSFKNNKEALEFLDKI